MQEVGVQTLQATVAAPPLLAVETLALLAVLAHHHLLQLSQQQIQRPQLTTLELYVSPQAGQVQGAE
jgi:hypothetical protein